MHIGVTKLMHKSGVVCEPVSFQKWDMIEVRTLPDKTILKGGVALFANSSYHSIEDFEIIKENLK